MSIKLYNTLTGKKEIFKALKDKKVSIYTCGPTVYDFAHIGNLRTYIFEDILRRVFKFNGYKIKQVMNITDIEDKIITKMNAEKKTLKEITEPFTAAFFKDLEKLGIQKAEAYPKATKHIKEIIRLIEILLEKGFAYKSGDGSIYFKISKFKKYGKLSRLDKRQIKTSGRANKDEYSKEETVDFALWKAVKPNEPSWPSPFGKGRPGWHIECSAMSMKYLGKTFDIHCGAVDLIFPHHENEIAQSEAATGKIFVNFWIEGEHLLVDSKKMSKSLGNFYTLADLENRGFQPLAFRYLALTAHYRSHLNFTWKGLEAGQNSLNNLIYAVININSDKNSTTDPLLSEKLEKEFLAAVNDDLNMPKALSVFHKTIRSKKISRREKRKLILKFDEVLGLNLKNIKFSPAPPEIIELAGKREKLRKEQKWNDADQIRREIEKLGWIVKDTKIGPEITKSNQ